MRRALFLACAGCAILLAAADARAQGCGTNISCATSPAGFAVTSTNANPAILGTNSLATGGNTAIKGVAASSGNQTAGVLGADQGIGFGTCWSTAPSAGVRGDSTNHLGVIGLAAFGQAGVVGYSLAAGFCPTAPNADGMLGVHRNNHYYGVFADGDFGGTGAKYFVEPHPYDASKEIRYVSLEGPEAGTYFRGSGRTVHGYATIAVPESFRMVTDAKGLTVVVTPIGEMAMVAVVRKGLDRIVIQASKDIRFDYMVNGVRRAFRDFQAISENDDFVPEGPDDSRFFTLPKEAQERLIATGVYTAEGRVNVAKAREMGWDRRWRGAAEAGDVLAAQGPR
jgi:hypothetical protein